MQRKQWNTQQIKQFEEETGKTLLLSEQRLFNVNHDFGGLSQGHAQAIFQPSDVDSVQSICQYATQQKLPLTIRGNGLSQSGQSLAPLNGLSVDVSQLNCTVKWHAGKLIAGCSATWKTIIETAFEHGFLPHVFPHNTNLSLGGVISAGGLGASSFKEGVIAAHIENLSVVTAEGKLLHCNAHTSNDLFNTCLSGVGLFGIIYEATLTVRPCKSQVWVGELLYSDYQQWLEDQFILKKHCDYLEAYIADDVSKTNSGKIGMIKMAIEYETHLPDLSFLNDLQFNQVVKQEKMPLLDYVYRHEGRLKNMQDTGAWDSLHPWYECCVGGELLLDKLPEIIKILNAVAYKDMYHIFPVAPHKPRFFMLPEADKIVTFNLLLPGLDKKNSAPTLKALQEVNEILLGIGAKRYISGWFGNEIDNNYWAVHYGSLLQEKTDIKTKYDPEKIFCSQLFPNR